MLVWQYRCQSTCKINNILLVWLTILTFYIHHLTARTILTQNEKVRNQVDTVEKSRNYLTYSVKVRDQIYNFPYEKIVLFYFYFTSFSMLLLLLFKLQSSNFSMVGCKLKYIQHHKHRKSVFMQK